MLGLGSTATPAGSLGYVSLLAFAVVAPLAAAIAPFGVRLAHRFTRAQLRIGFGLLLIAVSAKFWRRFF